MAEEWLDLVDEFDRVVGQATHAQCHSAGLRHRAVHVEVVNPNRTHILVYRRSHAGAIVAQRGLIDIVGGHVRVGEDPATTARRELEEEFALTIPLTFILSFSDEWSIGAVRNCEVVYLFHGEWSGDPTQLHPDPAEGGQPWWMPIAELVNEVQMHPNRFAYAARHAGERFGR